MVSLHARYALLIATLFAIIYAIVVMFGTAMGVNNFNVYLGISIAFMLIQYLIGPSIIGWTMGIKYIKREDNFRLWDMVEEQAQRAQIPMPKVCISKMPIPNAFAFGRGVRDGRVCVTEGIMRLLNEQELRAVIGHELAHIKNRDVLTITLLSVIPMIMYRLAWHFMYSGGYGRRNEGGSTAMLGLIAFLFYFLTNLLVLYASRIREYFADKGSVSFGNHPSALASALYKLVYGSARMDRSMLKQAEGFKAFFLNDPSRAGSEIRELAQLDLDKSGTLDSGELLYMRDKNIKMDFGGHMMEVLSTHPNMLKRIKHLSELS